MLNKRRKKDGFQGQKAIIIPRSVLQGKCVSHALINSLYITDIGYYPKAHFHYRQRPSGADQHILIYCHEGAGTAIVHDQSYTLLAGDFLIIPAKVKHTYVADAHNPWTIYWMHFNGNLAEAWAQQLIRHLNGHKGFLPDVGKTIALFDEMYGQLERGYSMDHLMHCNMCAWHYLASFLYEDKGRAVHNSISDTVDQAISFMKQNVDQNLTLEGIAQAVNFSASHFSLLFRKKTGFAPIEYYNHLKMQHACQFLLFTDKRIKEIGLAVGISDQQYFSRIFKKTMGVSPQQYRSKRTTEEMETNK
ncbi:AraC family transcriptional regulator [Chitinophaga horti]|uniref:AraC family transcriptional regulator n=1 Tax=Chitinophaga horti TaxID=2920382 RepID=A0ABY6IY07_9BACT|nr:AraC family transcriptional regulator [Chitinophaga horti]UYQ90974.1 AraC family transcriptional regulator [Chitinophaga horti]